MTKMEVDELSELKGSQKDSVERELQLEVERLRNENQILQRTIKEQKLKESSPECEGLKLEIAKIKNKNSILEWEMAQMKNSQGLSGLEQIDIGSFILNAKEFIGRTCPFLKVKKHMEDQSLGHFLPLLEKAMSYSLQVSKPTSL